VAARLYWDQHRASQCIENDMDVLQGPARVDLHIQTDMNLHIHLDPIISPPVPRSSPGATGATGRNGRDGAYDGGRRPWPSSPTTQPSVPLVIFFASRHGI
jgi:hypothetical protein